MSLDLKKQLITQLIESSRLLRNYVDHRAKSRGTTRAQWIVLFRLREQEGLSQVDLADVLELQPISLVRLLDRLVEHGLVERRSDPRDRRANRLFLTAAGRQLADDLDSLREAIATDVLQGTPAATIETSLKALRDIKERIKPLAEPAGNVAAKLRRRTLIITRSRHFLKFTRQACLVTQPTRDKDGKATRAATPNGIRLTHALATRRRVGNAFEASY